MAYNSNVTNSLRKRVTTLFLACAMILSMICGLELRVLADEGPSQSIGVYVESASASRGASQVEVTVKIDRSQMDAPTAGITSAALDVTLGEGLSFHEGVPGAFETAEEYVEFGMSESEITSAIAVAINNRKKAATHLINTLNDTPNPGVPVNDYGPSYAPRAMTYMFEGKNAAGNSPYIGTTLITLLIDVASDANYGNLAVTAALTDVTLGRRMPNGNGATDGITDYPVVIATAVPGYVTVASTPTDGTISITAAPGNTTTAPKFGETLTAAYAGTDTITSYQWYKTTGSGSPVAITGATAATYTISYASGAGPSAADEISVEVSASGKTSISSAPTGGVVKKAGALAAALTDATASTTTNAIVVTTPNPAHEYYVSETNTTPTAGTAAIALTGLSAGTEYYVWVRAKETDEAYAGAWSASTKFTTVSEPISGSVTITGNPKVGETLTAEYTGNAPASKLNYKWYIKGTTASIGAASTYVPTVSDLNKEIQVDVTAANFSDGPITAAAVGPVAAGSQTVTVAVVPAKIPVGLSGGKVVASSSVTGAALQYADDGLGNFTVDADGKITATAVSADNTVTAISIATGYNVKAENATFDIIDAYDIKTITPTEDIDTPNNQSVTITKSRDGVSNNWDVTVKANKTWVVLAATDKKTVYFDFVPETTGCYLFFSTNGTAFSPVPVDADSNYILYLLFDAAENGGVDKFWFADDASGTNRAEVNVTFVDYNTFRVQVSADPAEGGTVSGGGNYAVGASATVLASSAVGYTFDGWYESGKKVDGAAASYSFKVTSNRTLVAKFTKQSGGDGDKTPVVPPANPNGPGTPPVTDAPTTGTDTTTDGTAGGADAGTGDETTDIGGGSTVTTPEDKPPVPNPGGGSTLPGGGTVNLPDGGTIAVPPGTVISGDGGMIVIPRGWENAEIVYPDGRTEMVEPGYLIDISNPQTPLASLNLPFTDVNPGDWFYDDVVYVYIHGLFSGTGTNAFSPNASMTRKMIVTVLYRLAGEPEVSGGAAFGDTDANAYYAKAVAWAKANGIVGGVGGNLFAPDSPVTRQDLAVILLRYANHTGAKLPEMRDYSGFRDDTDSANYAKDAIEAFFKAGVINGKGNDLFDPKGTATRAELAAMLHRFIEGTRQ
ncbi:hypothetical protein FACS1894105_04030 [Clostridia bacterium]|nr:hypothetical protein FACS1894105_04030 [Clostridia bacterium]